MKIGSLLQKLSKKIKVAYCFLRHRGLSAADIRLINSTSALHTGTTQTTGSGVLFSVFSSDILTRCCVSATSNSNSRRGRDRPRPRFGERERLCCDSFKRLRRRVRPDEPCCVCATQFATVNNLLLLSGAPACGGGVS